MDDPHPLKSLLQLQLASDASAVLHLPYIIEVLSPQHFLPSPHTQKWCTRVNSLLHARDPGARWSGLCIALQTAVYSRSLMMEYATSWIGVALPILSKDEPVPNLKAAIRLLRHMFSSAMEVPEYQRQVCFPNVPKFSNALISLAEKRYDLDLRLLVMSTLTHLIPLFPTLHRSLHQSISSVTFKFLNGSGTKFIPTSLLEAASGLYSVLHVTGGKVGAANLWRKSLDETMGHVWNTFENLRRTSETIRGQTILQPPGEDPVMSIPLGLDRLRAAIRILCDLLCSLASRPVTLPVGSLVQLCLEFLRCTPEDKPVEGHTDPAVRAMKLAIIPSIWAVACDLVVSLSLVANHHLSPHLPQLLSHLVYHLEQQRTSSQRLGFLNATRALLAASPHLHDSILSSRLARGIAPSLVPLLFTKSQAQAVPGATATRFKNKKGKKRAREYESDEVFGVAADVICKTEVDGEVLILSLDAIRSVLRKSQLTQAVRSFVSRMLLSIHIALPQVQPAFVSYDLSLHKKLCTEVEAICVELASGTSNVLSKSLGLVIRGVSPTHYDTCTRDILRDVEVLLHPRVPPLVRSLPHVEMLSLFRDEECDEEITMRQALRLATAGEIEPTLSSAGHESAAPLVPGQAGNRPEVDVGVGPSMPTSRGGVLVENSAIQMPPSAASASHLSLAPAQVVAAPATAQNTFTPPNQGKLDILQTQNAPHQSPTTPSTRVAPIAASSASMIQPPAVDASATPTTSATQGVQPQSHGAIPMDQDDEDEPMPNINMDSDTDGDG